MAARTNISASQEALQNLLNVHYGLTPAKALLAFADKGNLDAVKVAVAAGAAMEARSPIHRRTGLHVAAARGHLPVVKFLLDHGANAEMRDDKGQTPLMLASLRTEGDIARYLLKRGALVDAEDEKGNTPLIVAADKHFPQMVRLLLEAKANPNLQNKAGETALHAAVRRGCTAANVITLLESGARTDIPDAEEQTPLDLAETTARRENSILRRDILNRVQKQRQKENFAAQQATVKLPQATLMAVFGSLSAKDLGVTPLQQQRRAPAAKGAAPT